jgi:hypothetical protein
MSLSAAAPRAHRGLAQPGEAVQMVAHDISARFLSNLMRSAPYRDLPPEQRIGWRRAAQSLRARREALAEYVLRTLGRPA